MVFTKILEVLGLILPYLVVMQPILIMPLSYSRRCGIIYFNYCILQGDEAVSRGISVEKDQGKEIDEMLSSLGVAPVSGMICLNF